MALTFRSPIETIAVHSIRSASLNAMVDRADGGIAAVRKLGTRRVKKQKPG
jgi:hypothetical protein